MNDLEEIISASKTVSCIENVPEEVRNWLQLIGQLSFKRKGLYTVLTTLLYYKYLHPEQDIRRHQAQLAGGFSGRSFDTANVTPVLCKCKLPAMAESGWLTRSLEQPYPYDFNYNGKIPAVLKEPFLKSLDFVQHNPNSALNMLRILLNQVIKTARENKVIIAPLSNPDKISIEQIINALQEHFLFKYGTHGGAKLPVLAFYSIYSSLIYEIKRYSGCQLADLSSLTACDRTNKASGDIEIFRDGSLYEAIEIKLDKPVDAQIVRIAKNKICQWNPQRYYILSVYGAKDDDKPEIAELVSAIADEHGCQLIVNGLIPTIKYYLRLIETLSSFLKNYSDAVEKDEELQKEHKEKWNEIIAKYNL